MITRDKYCQHSYEVGKRITVYSVLDPVKIVNNNPVKNIISLSSGFETKASTTAIKCAIFISDHSCPIIY